MIVSWITLLDSVPELELIQHLPAFLPGLFRTLYGRYPTSAFRKREDKISVTTRFFRTGVCGSLSVCLLGLAGSSFMYTYVRNSDVIMCVCRSDPNDSIQAMAVAVFEDFNFGIKAINDGSEIPLVLAVVEILIPLVAAKMLSVGGSGGASGAEVHDSTGAGTGGVNILQKQVRSLRTSIPSNPLCRFALCISAGCYCLTCASRTIPLLSAYSSADVRLRHESLRMYACTRAPSRICQRLLDCDGLDPRHC